MLSTLVAIFYYAFYLGLSGIVVLFFMRLYIALKLKMNRKDMMMTLFIPGSIGLSLKAKSPYPFENAYFYLNVFFGTMMLIGSIYILYLYLELDII